MHYFQLTKTGRFEYGCGEYKVIPVAIGAQVTCLRCNYGIVKELVFNGCNGEATITIAPGRTSVITITAILFVFAIIV